MSTVIVPAASQPTTKDHCFRMITKGGREAIVTVTAMRDITPEAVLADVRQSLAPDAELKPYPCENPFGFWFGFWSVLGMFLFLWVVAGLLTLLGAMVCDVAGFITLDSVEGVASLWPSWVPLAGGLHVVPGLTRLWLLVGGIIVGFLCAAAFLEKKSDRL